MEKKTYQITFKADLSEDDLRAMKKCFYDAMLDAMEISPVWDLKVEPAEDPDEPEPPDLGKYQPSLEELLKIPMDHIQKVKDCFEVCKSRDDVVRVIRTIPNMFGCFCVEFDTENEGFSVLNTYTDAEDEYQEEEYWFDFPEDWDYCDDPDVDEELLAEYKKEGED